MFVLWFPQEIVSNFSRIPPLQCRALGWTDTSLDWSNLYRVGFSKVVSPIFNKVSVCKDQSSGEQVQGQKQVKVDRCEAAKFNLIDYFSTQDFGINIQPSIFQDKNFTFLNNQVFFNTTILNIKTIKYFSTKFF